MVATFKSLRQPLLLLVSVPFAATGAILLQIITGVPLGVASLIGVLMLIGIVVTNAIVLVDLVNQYRTRGLSAHDATVAGGSRRLRPILMTALATIFALTPMALGITGHGGFISQPLAIVVIGGLVSSTILTLLVLPTLYNLVEGARERRAARRESGADAEAGALEPVLVGAGAAGAAEHALTRRELRLREASAAAAAGTASAAAIEAPAEDAQAPADEASVIEARRTTARCVEAPADAAPVVERGIPGVDGSAEAAAAASVIAAPTDDARSAAPPELRFGTDGTTPPADDIRRGTSFLSGHVNERGPGRGTRAAAPNSAPTRRRSGPLPPIHPRPADARAVVFQLRLGGCLRSTDEAPRSVSPGAGACRRPAHPAPARGQRTGRPPLSTRGAATTTVSSMLPVRRERARRGSSAGRPRLRAKNSSQKKIRLKPTSSNAARLMKPEMYTVTAMTSPSPTRREARATPRCIPRSIHRLDSRMAVKEKTAPVEARSCRNSLVFWGITPTKDRWMPIRTTRIGTRVADRRLVSTAVPAWRTISTRSRQPKRTTPTAGRDERRVEEVAGEHREGAQAAEVQLPPQRVGCGHDREQGPTDQHRGGQKADLRGAGAPVQCAKPRYG